MNLVRKGPPFLLEITAFTAGINGRPLHNLLQLIAIGVEIFLVDIEVIL